MFSTMETFAYNRGASPEKDGSDLVLMAKEMIEGNTPPDLSGEMTEKLSHLLIRQSESLWRERDILVSELEEEADEAGEDDTEDVATDEQMKRLEFLEDESDRIAGLAGDLMAGSRRYKHLGNGRYERLRGMGLYSIEDYIRVWD